MTSVNLAMSIAMGMEEHVLLIDADMRLPNVHTFPGNRKPMSGLSDYLTRSDLDLNQVIYKTPMEKLMLLPAGTREPRAGAELLSSEKMRRLVAEVRERYSDRFIIFDTSPVDATTEPSILASVMDAVLLVIRSGSVSIKLINETVNLIGREKIRGIVFNFSEESRT